MTSSGGRILQSREGLGRRAMAGMEALSTELSAPSHWRLVESAA